MNTTVHAGSTLLFDFSQPEAVQAWAAIDDRVMGGISRSQLHHDASGHAVFEGVVSLANNGGFASVRCSPGNRGRAGATCCLLEVRGEPQPFKLSLLTDDGFDSVNYQAGFTPAAGGGWHTLSLPLSGFRARLRGREVPGAPPLDPARIRQVGLMRSGGPAGEFALGIRWLALG
ncbi:CIA30 family protein [Pelomonas sp. HMWF004]|nr:CIA30 family protein [Pelomonas sp. HMWF004]